MKKRSNNNKVVTDHYCGAGEEKDRYNDQAKEDDARQYGVVRGGARSTASSRPGCC